MILIDTSAWVEFLRDTGSVVCDRVEALLESDIATCDVVRMEVLAGARDERHLRSLQRLLGLSCFPWDLLTTMMPPRYIAPVAGRERLFAS